MGGGSEAEIRLRLSSAELLTGTRTQLGNKVIVWKYFVLISSMLHRKDGSLMARWDRSVPDESLLVAVQWLCMITCRFQ